MNIEVRFSPPRRVWHNRLAERLESAGHRVSLRAQRTKYSLPLLECRFVLGFERLMYGNRSRLFAPVVDAVDHRREPDLVIDLTANTDAPGTSIQPLFDNAPGEASLLNVLLHGRAPTIQLRRSINGSKTILLSGRPASETPDVLWRSLDQVLIRLIGLILQAVLRSHVDGCAPTEGFETRTPPSSPIAFFVRGLAGAIPRRFGAAKGSPNHWRIAYRDRYPESASDGLDWTAGRFTVVPCTDDRFYADPFAFAKDGRRYVFFEDYPYATKKGVISVIEIGRDGRASVPRVVLEQPVHLSYPFIFEHAGSVYMLPEMGGAARIQLFRADPFPDRWVADKILVEDIVAGDATMVQHEQAFWIFATLAGDGGSSWDQLGIFKADSPLGPWTAHPGNPVLVDAGASRPGGAMWHRREGILMRAAQDCRSSYGIGLAICRVDRLDMTDYRQTVIARYGGPAAYGADGMHTLNRSGGLEVIDLRYPHA